MLRYAPFREISRQTVVCSYYREDPMACDLQAWYRPGGGVSYIIINDHVGERLDVIVGVMNCEKPSKSVEARFCEIIVERIKAGLARTESIEKMQRRCLANPGDLELWLACMLRMEQMFLGQEQYMFCQAALNEPTTSEELRDILLTYSCSARRFMPVANLATRGIYFGLPELLASHAVVERIDAKIAALSPGDDSAGARILKHLKGCLDKEQTELVTAFRSDNAVLFYGFKRKADAAFAAGHMPACADACRLGLQVQMFPGMKDPWPDVRVRLRVLLARCLAQQKQYHGALDELNKSADGLKGKLAAVLELPEFSALQDDRDFKKLKERAAKGAP